MARILHWGGASTAAPRAIDAVPPSSLSFAVPDWSQMNLPLPAPQPPAEFLVVGEHRDDPLQLLLLGIDGRHYAYTLPEGDPTPIEPDDGWRVEVTAADDLFG